MANKKDFVQKLSDLLLELGIITELSLKQVQKEFAGVAQENFEDFLLEEGLVSRSDLLKILSMYYEVPAFDARGVFFDTVYLRKFPKGMLHRLGVIPYSPDENMLIVIAAQPDDSDLPLELGKFVSYDLRFQVGLRRDIGDAISEYYDESDTEGLAKKEDQEISDEDANPLS